MKTSPAQDRPSGINAGRATSPCDVLVEPILGFILPETHQPPHLSASPLTIQKPARGLRPHTPRCPVYFVSHPKTLQIITPHTRLCHDTLTCSAISRRALADAGFSDRVFHHRRRFPRPIFHHICPTARRTVLNCDQFQTKSQKLRVRAANKQKRLLLPSMPISPLKTYRNRKIGGNTPQMPQAVAHHKRRKLTKNRLFLDIPTFISHVAIGFSQTTENLIAAREIAMLTNNHTPALSFTTIARFKHRKETDAPSQHRSANQKAVKTQKKDEPPRKKKTHSHLHKSKKTRYFHQQTALTTPSARQKKRPVLPPKQPLPQNIQYICETGQKLLIFCVTFCPEKFGRKAANFSMKISRRKRQILFFGWILGCDRPP